MHQIVSMFCVPKKLGCAYFPPSMAQSEPMSGKAPKAPAGFSEKHAVVYDTVQLNRSIGEKCERSMPRQQEMNLLPRIK